MRPAAAPPLFSRVRVNAALAGVTGYHLAKGPPGQQVELLRAQARSALKQLRHAQRELKRTQRDRAHVQRELREARRQLGWTGREPANRRRDWVIPARYETILKPGTMIDVGANSGTPQLYATFPDAFHLLIEPMVEHAEDLRQILQNFRGDYETVAVGAQPGTAFLHVEPRRGPMSSLLARTADTATGDEVERRPVQVERLDDIVRARDLPKPFGVKIDTEGFELEVIKGASETLAETQFVILECSTTKRFEGSYESVDLIEAMRGHGFVVFDVMRSGPRIVDLLFMRPDSSSSNWS